MGERWVKIFEMRMTVRIVKVMLAVWCRCHWITVLEAKGDSILCFRRKTIRRHELNSALDTASRTNSALDTALRTGLCYWRKTLPALNTKGTTTRTSGARIPKLRFATRDTAGARNLMLKIATRAAGVCIPVLK